MFPASRLEAVFGMAHARPDAPRTGARRALLLGLAAVVVCAGLVWGGETVSSRMALSRESSVAGVWGQEGSGVNGGGLDSLAVLLKLASAAVIGLLVTAVHRHVQRRRPVSRSMEQAQTLLCVSGALMMIIIGNSLARAFGIAGAAAIIRFRTPVDDPRDTTILFLLLALGMAAGIGALPLAGLGTLCLCLLLPVLDRFSEPEAPATRSVAVELVARDSTFPTEHVHGVLARHGVTFELREMSNGEAARMKYQATLDSRVSLEALSEELLQGGTAGIASLAWDTRKKG
jgi:hypothetical protein